MGLQKIINGYLRASTATADDVRDFVWTSAVGPAEYTGAGEKYQAAILEQYRIYVEMTDRVSARRGLTNTFFLTLNTLVLTTAGVFWRDLPRASVGALAFPLFVLLLQCVSWFWLLRSYRQLNLAKYIVVGLLEERLPASPYWRAEWKALGEGHDPSRYWPLSHLEQWVPAFFAVVYLTAFVIALVA